MPGRSPTMSAEYFDQWYTDMSSHPHAKDEFVNSHLGLPPEIKSTSLLTMSGLLEVRDILGLTEGDLLLDVACGRGGYGLWLARDTGAHVTGVDFSAVAIEMARANVAAFGVPSDRAEFLVDSMEETGVPDNSVDAVICVDAIQFAGDPVSVAAEFVRVLRPGGRVVVTSWEALDRGDERVPEARRRLDLVNQLAAGGLREVHVVEHQDWREVEEAMWTDAIGVDPGDDPAFQALKDEAARVLPTFRSFRRVLGTGVAP